MRDCGPIGSLPYSTFSCGDLAHEDLAAGLSPRRPAEGSTNFGFMDHSAIHQAWVRVFYKVVDTRTALIEILDYIHSNPVSKRWQLVEDRASYPYSSACFYDEDKAPIIPVDDIRELL